MRRLLVVVLAVLCLLPFGPFEASAWAQEQPLTMDRAVATALLRNRDVIAVRLSRARAAAGEISEAELHKIELEGMKYGNALIDADLDLTLARQRLAALMGLRSESELPGPAVATDAPRAIPTLQPLMTRALE